MHSQCLPPDSARNRKQGPLSKHAVLNSALHTHARQNPPKHLRRPRPRLRRQRAFIRVKAEETFVDTNPQDAPMNDISRRIEAYKTGLDTYSILPSLLPPSNTDLFARALEQIRLELASGTGDVDSFCGSHAHPAAIINSTHYKTAPRLCQIIADILQELRPAERMPSATTIALMWLHWCLWTWLISPSPETYSRIPIIMRPTLTQVSISHDLAVDFIPSPSLRDSFCRRQANHEWPLSDLFQAAFCYGPKNTLCSLIRDSDSQTLDIAPECKALAKNSGNWSFDASAEQAPQDTLMPPTKRRNTMTTTT